MLNRRKNFVLSRIRGTGRRYADLSEIRPVKIRQSFDTCIFFGSIGPEFPSCMRDRPAVPYFIICYHVVCQIAISKKTVGEIYASIYSGGRTPGTRNARSVPRIRCAVRHRNLQAIFAGVCCHRGASTRTRRYAIRNTGSWAKDRRRLDLRHRSMQNKASKNAHFAFLSEVYRACNS